MTQFSTVTGKQLLKILKKLGFDVIRSKGSHHFLKHPDGRCTVIPIHRSESIGKGLLAQILHDCELTKEDFKNMI